jgi:uncharacterized protein (DUF2235 family)
MKRLIVCCDGTWNTPDQQSRGEWSATNVTKVALAITPRDDNGLEQRTFYHRGVGTSRGQRISGGAFGLGLSRDVRATYRFLVQNFDPGDELFFFGFSRGAFTARSTAGFVRNCGILRRSEEHRIDEAYDLYRSRASTTHPRGTEATLFRRTYSHDTPINFIGVWDTVGALGVPLNGLRLVNLLNRRWQFHDTNLSTTVGAAFQALAIDERRGPFRPAVWTPQPDAPRQQKLEQVWFTGVHCDVGGGYREHQLSDIPLLWLVDRAKSCGVSFDTTAFGTLADDQSEDDDTLRARTAVKPDPYGEPHDSRTRFYRLIPPYIRPIGKTDPRHEYVASSAEMSYDKTAPDKRPGLAAYLDGPHQVMEVDSFPAPPS